MLKNKSKVTLDWQVYSALASANQILVYRKTDLETIKKLEKEVEKFRSKYIVRKRDSKIESTRLRLSEDLYDEGIDVLKDNYPILYEIIISSIFQTRKRTRNLYTKLLEHDPEKETEHIAGPNGEEFKLRKKQVRFFNKLREYIESNPHFHTGFVKYPTGIGKTIIMGMLLRLLNKSSEEVDVDTKALVISNTNIINTQNKDKIQGLQHPGTDVEFYKKSTEDTDIVIATYNLIALDGSIERHGLGMRKVILLDEVHKSFGPKVVRHLREHYPDAFIIGLSATPYVGTGENQRTAFDYFEGEIDSVSLMEAIQDGDLSDMYAWRLVTNKENFDDVERQSDYDKKIDLKQRTNIAVQIAQNLIEENEKTMVFCHGVEHSKDTAKALCDAGFSAVHVDGKMKYKKEIKPILDAFKRGKYQYICSCDILIEGFDEESVECGIALRPVKSLSKYEQMLGRTLRLDPSNPNKVAKWFDVVDQHANQQTVQGLAVYYGVMKEQYRSGERVFTQETEKEHQMSNPEDEEQNKQSTESIAGLKKIGRNLDSDIRVQDIVLVEDINSSRFFQKNVDSAIDLEIIKKILSKHGITDRESLLSFGVIEFNRADFLYGKGRAFAGKILGQAIPSHVTKEILEEIADKLGWEELDEELKLDKYREELKKHRITNRESLLSFGVIQFIGTDFGIYGKGRSFAVKILEETIQRNVTKEILEEIADKLGWEELDEESKLDKYREEFEKHGITDREDLRNFGTEKFKTTNFGSYGKGLAFAGIILGQAISRNVRKETLEEIADKLGWEELDEESMLDKYREELKKYGITNRESLLSFGVKQFIETDFGIYGKGTAFVNKILGKTIQGKVTKEILEEIADKLGWEELDEEVKLDLYREEFKKNDIRDREDLRNFGPIKFSEAVFFGKYTSRIFAGKILGQTQRFITKETLEEIADKLGWEELDEESKLDKYREELKKYDIKDRKSLLDYKVGNFKATNFGLYGKGAAFGGKILGEKIKGNLVKETLEKIADKLGW